MSIVTKPILLNETGIKIAENLTDICNAIRGYAPEKKEWSIVINNSSSNPTLGAMSGDVNSWLRYRSKIGRYLMTPEGKAYKLHPENSRLYPNGQEVNVGDNNVMVRIPRLYYKVTTSGSLVTLTMCEREFAENCEVIDEQWVGAYLGYVVGGKLRSMPDKNPTRSKTITDFWNLSQAYGQKWGLVNYEQRKAMIMLYLCEYLDLNSQASLGNGMTGNGDNWCTVVQNATTGATSALGDECGKVMFTESGQKVSGACHISLFGIEDPYGWFWEMIQGCYFGNSENDLQNGDECYIYEGNRMPNEEELKSNPTSQYRKIPRPITSGYVKTMLLGEKFDVIPSALGGSSASYWCDYHYANDKGQLLLWGGAADGGSIGGLGSSSSYLAFSYSLSSFGSRLAYYGGDVEIFENETTTSQQ